MSNARSAPTRVTTQLLVALFAAVFIVCSAGALALDTTTNGRPTVNATFYETAIPMSIALADAPTNTAIRTTSTTGTGSPVTFSVTTLLTLLTTPSDLLDNVVHNVLLRASDLSGNTGNYTYSFKVAVPGQQITLIEPLNGGTTNKTVAFTIQSQFPSTCRYNMSTILVRDATGFASMQDFTVVTANQTLHSVTDILTVLGLQNIQPNQVVPLVVSCNDGNRTTAARFSITYLTAPPATCTGSAADCPPTPNGTTPYTMQQIKLLTPLNGITPNATTALTVKTDRDSACRYLPSATMVTTRSGYLSMFALTPSASNTIHTVVNVSTALGRNILPNETVPIAVTCDDGAGLSYSLFTITYKPGQDPSAPGSTTQNITLIAPVNGATSTLPTTVTVGTDVASECRWLPSTTLLSTAANFNAMNTFDQVPAGNRTHTITDFYASVRKNPTTDDTTTIAVTCRASGNYTATVFAINYRAPIVPPTWKMQQIKLITPLNGVTANSTATLTVQSERFSTCRYSLSTSMVTTNTGYLAMTALTPSVGNTIHAVANVFSLLGRSPRANETVPVAVTCDDGTALSYTLFTITYTPGFDPSAPGSTTQNITLVAPANGVTSTLPTTVTVGTDLASECRWLPSTTLLPTTTNFNAMNTFDQVLTGNRTHTISNFYSSVGKNPTTDDTTTIAVTCRANGNYTATVFAINYRVPSVVPIGSGGPRTSVIVVTNPNDPTAYITVNADQDVWCSLNGLPMTGPKVYDNFNRTVSGNYTQLPGTAIPTVNVTICCENRAALSTCFNQTIAYQFIDAVAITVVSPNSTAASSYALHFTTDKLAYCTAKLGTQALTLTPASTSLGTDFTSSAATVQTGIMNFSISCTSAVGTQTNKTFILSADRTPPKIYSTDLQGKTCDLTIIRFRVNASDPDPGSGIAAYQYSLVDSRGNITAGPYNSSYDSNAIRSLKLVNGSTYTLQVIVYDGAGNPSALHTDQLKATDASDRSCDLTAPVVLVVQEPGGGKTNVTVVCSDVGGSGCASTFQYQLVAANATTECSVTSTSPTTSFSTPFIVTQDSYLCYVASDLAGNTIHSTARIYVTSTPIAPLTPGTIIANLSSGTCTDGIKNRDEVDVDCGGYACGVLLKKLCAANQTCATIGDCTSGVCSAGKCAGNSCTDGMRDGSETDIDCGGTDAGSTCTVCAEGLRCQVDSDCATGTTCQHGYCTIAPEKSSPAPNTQPPTTDSSGGGGNIWKWILIALGAVMLIGGSGYAILYDPRHTSGTSHGTQATTASDSFGHSFNEPIARFPEPSHEHGDQLTTRTHSGSASDENAPAMTPRERIRSREAQKKQEREDKLKAFETGDDLAAVPNITHHEIERAAKDLPAAEMKKTLRTLSNADKVSTKDIAIAVKDLESSGSISMDAIEDLKKEFKIGDAAQPKQKKP